MTQCCCSYIVLYNLVMSCFFFFFLAVIGNLRSQKKNLGWPAFQKSLSVHWARNNLAFTTTWTLKPIAHPELRHLSLFVRLFVLCGFFSFLSHCRLCLCWPPPPLSSKCRKLKRPQSKTLLVGQESLSLHSTVWWDLRAAGSCCQQSLFFAKKKKSLKYNTHLVPRSSTPCCDGYSSRWCPQVKGSPSGWEVEAGMSLSWAWRDLRRKTPVGVSGKGKVSHSGRCFVQKVGLQNIYTSLSCKNSTLWMPARKSWEIPSVCYHLSVQQSKRLRPLKTVKTWEDNLTSHRVITESNTLAEKPGNRSTAFTPIK